MLLLSCVHASATLSLGNWPAVRRFMNREEYPSDELRSCVMPEWFLRADRTIQCVTRMRRHHGASSSNGCATLNCLLLEEPSPCKAGLAFNRGKRYSHTRAN